MKSIKYIGKGDLRVLPGVQHTDVNIIMQYKTSVEGSSDSTGCTN